MTEGSLRRPLDDVRVLAIEQYGAGPYGTSHLVELGAEVIKIEDLAAGGDVGRQVPPFAADGDSLFFQTFNLGKKSISLDLRSGPGYETFLDLVANVDAVYSNLRGDVPDKLGITYRHLSPANPRIVCCSLSGFGMTGPRASEPGYDYLLQGMAGWMSLTGEPDGPPSKTGLSVVDYCGGLFAAMALMAGIHAARRDGRGMDCDVSLFDVAISMLTYPATWLLNRDYDVGRRANSAHPSLVPFQAFETSDGWIVVACPKEKFWRRFVEVLELPNLRDDPRFTSFASRLENETELISLLAKRIRARDTETWITLLESAGVPCGPVNSLRQALADPQLAERGLLTKVNHPTLGRIEILRSPLRVGERPTVMEPAPQVAAHTDEVLSELLGYGPERIAALRARGALGPQEPTQ